MRVLGLSPAPVCIFFEVKPQFKRNLSPLIFIAFITILSLSFVGCASNDETIIIRQDILRMDGEINRLKSEVKEVKKQSEGFSEQKYADLQTQIDTITSELKALDAKTDDVLQRINETDQEIARLKKEIQSQNERITEIEKKVSSPRKEKRVAPISSDITGASSPVETMYDDAYLSFTRGNFQEAREKFRAFLRKYPKTAYSDNARFWIGETYYSEGDFESAILEYEKVIRSYPRGDKVPSALLKEGLAFIKLGDKTDGRLVLKKLIKKYPRTDQARIAKQILRKIR